MSDTTGVAETSAPSPMGGTTPTLTCSAWATADDLPDDCPCRSAGSGGDTPDDAQLAELLAAATDALFVLLGRPAIGVCEITVQPCGIGGSYPLPGQRALGWRFGDAFCSSCGHDNDVWLDGPVHDVLEVVVDGVTLDPGDFYLEDGNWLVRASGSWPAGSRDPSDLAFVITYERGVPVDSIVREAVVELVNEFWLDRCGNLGQRVTSAVTSMSTGGTSYSYPDAQKIADALPKLPMTLKAVSTYNPTKATGQPFAYSPDVPRPRVIRTFA